MKSVASHGSLSLLFAMKVMISHFLSDAHKAMLHSLSSHFQVVVEFSLQFHRYIVVSRVMNF
jgi:hypothetical protein